MPTWVTTIVAALVGGIIVAALNAFYQKASEIRTRRIEAACDFLSGFHSALLGLRDIERWVLRSKVDPVFPSRGPSPDENVASAVVTGRRAIDEAHEALWRIQLLFGLESRAGSAAGDAIVGLRNAEIALFHEPESVRDSESMRYFDQHLEFAQTRQGDFVEAAGGVVNASLTRRLKGRDRPGGEPNTLTQASALSVSRSSLELALLDPQVSVTRSPRKGDNNT
jgi:hypothetical protein